MNGKVVMDCIDAAYVSIKQHADEIMVLDQTIGDGDHVFNLIRGLEALRGIRGDIEALDFGAALKAAANKVLSTVGGSSGPLFSSLLMGMSRACDHLNGDPRAYAQDVRGGRESGAGSRQDGKGQQDHDGRADPGRRALERARTRAPAGAADPCRAAEGSRLGMLATRDMLGDERVARPSSASARSDTSIRGAVERAHDHRRVRAHRQVRISKERRSREEDR
jgi:dihydroxyacetone kinase-like protein